MQYVVIVLIAAVAVALVMVPLVRGQRGAGVGDMDPPERKAAPPQPEPPVTPEPTVPEAPQPPGELDAEELPLVAPPPPFPPRPGEAGLSTLPRVEQEVLQYRQALRARTICPHCSAANPPGSKYCKECGDKL